MYEPYFPPPGKPQDGYGHISLPLAIIVTNQSFGFPSQRPVYLLEECVRKLLYCHSHTGTTTQCTGRRRLTQVQDDTR